LQTTQIDENETALLRQSFMFNPEQTVGELTAELGMQIVDFMRVQCGDSNKEAGGD
jgi:translation elongation factor EF-Ts